MRRRDFASPCLIIGLTGITLLGNWSLGADTLLASSSRFPEAENSHIVEGSRVTFQVTTIPSLPGLPSGTGVGEFIQGRHEIFPALEHAVGGMKAGQEKQVELSPEEWFGPYLDEKKVIISKTQLPPGTKQGDVVENARGELATGAEVGETTATVHYDRPLVGQPIVVKITILNVENP